MEEEGEYIVYRKLYLYVYVNMLHLPGASKVNPPYRPYIPMLQYRLPAWHACLYIVHVLLCFDMHYSLSIILRPSNPFYIVFGCRSFMTVSCRGP